MRDRLVELLKKADKYASGVCTDYDEAQEVCAEYLLAEGVIVPPCKVGQKIYMPWNWKGIEGIAILTVERISITEAGVSVRTDFYSDDYAYFSAYELGVFRFKHFGKTVFLTREEAEKAIEERREG